MNHRLLREDDLIDISEWFKQSAAWIQEEGLLKAEIEPQKLKVWMSLYDSFEGKWLMWLEGDIAIGLSFHVMNAPSNERPWIGMVMVEPKVRLQGYGRNILNQLAEKLSNAGERIIYTGCPFQRVEWLNFLAEGGFEQIGMEELPSGKQFIKLAKPL